MAGYLLTGGNSDCHWDFVLQRTDCSRQDLERYGFGLVLELPQGQSQYTVADMEPLLQFSVDSMEHEKYCVISDASLMTEVVQNKLLKLLEDSNIQFYLFAVNPSKILPTVRSRLIVINMDGENCEGERVNRLFSELPSRKELFYRLHMAKEKDQEHAFFGMNVPLFISEVENLFLLLIGYLSWGECSDKEEILKGMSKLWQTPDMAVRACGICEKHQGKANYTKDDLFVFIAELVEL